MVPVKICGITRARDAIAACEAGAGAIGFIFYEPSPRYIEPDAAKEIAESIPGDIPAVGVFVDEQPEKVNRMAAYIGFDIVQLHGHESPEYCDRIDRPVIKSFRITDGFSEISLTGYDVFAFLFDAYAKGVPGGTGNTFNWDLIKSLRLEIPVILAGGINAGNIREAYKTVNPAAFDVSSGVESSPGIKDPKEVAKLFGQLKDNDRGHNLFSLG